MGRTQAQENKVQKSNLNDEVVLAKERKDLDLATLREHAREKQYNDRPPPTLAGLFGNDREKRDSPNIIGISATISFGGGEKTEFHVGLDGYVGTGLGLVKAVTPKGSKVNEALDIVDPSTHINQAIVNKTGWQHNHNIDTRCQVEKATASLNKNEFNYERWASAAEKQKSPTFCSKNDETENAIRFVDSLISPVMQEFQRRQPKAQAGILKELKRELIHEVLNSKPLPDGKIHAGIKRILRGKVDLGMLDGIKLSEEAKKICGEILDDSYTNRLEKSQQAKPKARAA